MKVGLACESIDRDDEKDGRPKVGVGAFQGCVLFLNSISISAQSVENLFTFNIFSGQEMHLVHSIIFCAANF